ncbi:hypothetical protein WMY93_013702 [Mugilogobius chulae]|uniref:RRM domain-containing protein n=1 Tax=Mugilogobius chulae TaxID=88201 RepID=A0AAW0P0R7_9GOBI
MLHKDYVVRVRSKSVHSAKSLKVSATVRSQFCGHPEPSSGSSLPWRRNGKGLSQGNLFVGGLRWTTNEDVLSAVFRRYGIIKDIEVIKDKVTGRSRGFAFIKYYSARDAEVALTSMTGKTLDGNVIWIEGASRGGRPKDVTGAVVDVGEVAALSEVEEPVTGRS